MSCPQLPLDSFQFRDVGGTKDLARPKNWTSPAHRDSVVDEEQTAPNLPVALPKSIYREYECRSESDVIRFDPRPKVEDEVDSTAVDNPYGFTGRRIDEETGFYYYRARMYSAEMGRFLSRDPLGYVDGLNMYAYVGNNPLNFVDPSGMIGQEAAQVDGSIKGQNRSPFALSWADAGGGEGNIFDRKLNSLLSGSEILNSEYVSPNDELVLLAMAMKDEFIAAQGDLGTIIDENLSLNTHLFNHLHNLVKAQYGLNQLPNGGVIGRNQVWLSRKDGMSEMQNVYSEKANGFLSAIDTSYSGLAAVEKSAIFHYSMQTRGGKVTNWMINNFDGGAMAAHGAYSKLFGSGKDWFGRNISTGQAVNDIFFTGLAFAPAVSLAGKGAMVAGRIGVSKLSGFSRGLMSKLNNGTAALFKSTTGLSPGSLPAGTNLSRASMIQREVSAISNSELFISRAHKFGFNDVHLGLLPGKLNRMGFGELAEGGFVTDNMFVLGSRSMLSTRSQRIMHELGHVLDGIKQPGLFEKAASPGFGFSNFYRAEKVAYQMQYGFNPVPITVLNAGFQSSKTVTSSIVAGSAYGIYEFQMRWQ